MKGTAKKSTSKTSSEKENQGPLRRLRSGEIRTQLPPPARRSSSSVAVYDANGKIRGTQEDICDCFDKKCVGCHFPCDKCKSEKCGPTCRVYRRYFYETIEFDGKAEVKKNYLIN